MSEHPSPTITDPRITERGGMGHATIATTVTHPNEDPSMVAFVGIPKQYGPVVMILPSGAQTFVTDPGRHGPFGVEWVRSFFADAHTRLTAPPAVCEYDSGSATGCQPLCDSPAVWAITYRDGGSVHTSRLCGRHRTREINRLGALWIAPLSVERIGNDA